MWNIYGFLLIIYFLSLKCNLIFNQSSFIKRFDTINYEPNVRSRRSVSFNSYAKKSTIKFQAFKKNFHLTLFDDYTILHPNTEIIVDGLLRLIKGVTPVRGFMNNYQGSEVHGTIVDGVFRGTIKLDIHNHSSGTYYIEHSGYHFSNHPGFHSIIYHDSDVNSIDSTLSSGIGKNYCGLSHPDIAHKMHLSTLQHDSRNYSHQGTHSRFKRSANAKGSQYVCNLYLQSDTFLWDKVMGLHHVKGQHHLAVQEISSIFTQHVQGAQAIYANTKFQTFTDPSRAFDGIGFRVDRVRINTTADCEPPLRHSNPFCESNIDVTHFLNLNSYMKHDDFCLAYIFTYRDFNGGTLGLAWVGETGGSGGVCAKSRLMLEADQTVQKNLNTGIVTLLNYGSYVALKVSQLTFAHEMGHNFGSKHDEDHKDRPECLPSSNDPKGNFIMFASATSGEKDNNNNFSSCSRDSIARLLDGVIKSKNNCFSNQEGSFCGNKLTEDGEECDCGYSKNDCQDMCCNPKVSKAPCQLTKVVTIANQVKQVRCSPSAGECCSKDCQFAPGSRMCRSHDECYKEAFCSGTSNKCPLSEKMPDFTSCQHNTRVCKNGECVGSICESVQGWQECSIARSEHVTSDMMCFVACKKKSHNSPCISTFNLQKDSKLREQYPELVERLMRDGKAIQLKAGAPCDNFHGYCDVFLRCRSVEADGPLARLKGMLFSSLMLNKVKKWTTQFWWAVMLICIGGIVFVGIFIKVCSKSTPSTDPSIRPRSRTKSSRNHSHRHRCRHRHKHRHSGSRHTRSEVVANIETNLLAAPTSESSSRADHNSVPVRQPLIDGPQRPPRRRARPLSLFANDSNHVEAIRRPLSSTVESNIETQDIAGHNPPNYPPPAYECSIIMPRQHGQGRGKRGHRAALSHQASRYSDLS